MHKIIPAEIGSCARDQSMQRNPWRPEGRGLQACSGLLGWRPNLDFFWESGLCSFLMLLSHLSTLGLVDDFELVAWDDLCTQVPLLLVADAWKPCSVAVWL